MAIRFLEPKGDIMLSYFMVVDKNQVQDISGTRSRGQHPTNKQIEKHWHIGQSVPLIPEGYVVIQVQVEGDELDYILDNFNNIPTAKHSPYQNWFGDMAQFIIWNMPVGMTWDKNNNKTVYIKL